MVLKRADGQQVIELSIDHMTSLTHIGLDFLDSEFTLHTFNLKDHTFKLLHPDLPETSAPYSYLIETYIPLQDKIFSHLAHKYAQNSGGHHLQPKSKNALNAKFMNNPRIARSKDGCPLKLTLTSDSQLFLFANIDCVNMIKDMLLAAFAESQDGKALV